MSKADTQERYRFWMDVMEQYDRSGLTRKEFCDQNSLSFGKFRNWRCRINRKYKADNKATDNKFIPLVVTDPPVSKEVTTSHTLGLTLDPSGNISLSIPVQFNLEYLSSVLNVIRGVVC